MRELAKKFDGTEIDAIAVPQSAISAAANSVPAKLADSLKAAANRITEYQRSQLRLTQTHIADGIAVTDRSVAVKSAGLYVPGGKAAYPSTVLMTAIPARVAGVESIAICVPPDATGEVSPATLAAAELRRSRHRLSDRRSRGDSGIGLRHRKRRSGGCHSRAGQHLCRLGAAGGRRISGDSFGFCRPVGDRSHRR